MENLKRISIFAGIFLLIVQCAIYADYSVNLVESRGDETVVKFKLNDYRVAKRNIEGKECSVLNIGGNTAYTNEKGYPSLPYVTQSIAVPNNAEMALEVLEVKYREVATQVIEPARGPVSRATNINDVPHVFGDIYSQDRFYPSQDAQLSEPFIIRDVRGVTVQFNVAQYNAARGILKIADEVTVRVRSVGPGKVNVLANRGHDIAPAYEHVYETRFLNFNEVRNRYNPVADGDKMVIITPASLKSAIEPLAEWKNRTGIETEIVEYTGGGASSVQSTIKSQYKERNVTYVLLVGDDRDLPSLSHQGQHGTGRSDPKFAFIDGNDQYPEAFVGRFSASSANQITTMVNKTIKYEKEPLVESDHYVKAMGVASAEGNPTDKTWMEGFKNKLMEYGYTEIDGIYDPSASKQKVISAINSGRGWINYMGHGSTTSWGTTRFGSSDVPALTNGDKQPILISIACVNGEFNKECFAETFTRAEGKGGVIFLGSSINQAWTPPQYAMKEMLEQYLIKDKSLSVGSIIYNGEMKMVEMGNDGGTMATWILFGDPSLRPYTKKPMKVTVSDVSVNRNKVTFKLDKAITGRAAVYCETSGKCVATAMIKNSTTADLTITGTPSNKLTLTVTGLNYIPVIEDVSTNDIITNVSNKMSFNVHASGKIYFNLQSMTAKNVELTVYDYKGSVVRKQRNLNPWDMKNVRGSRIATGVYAVVVKFVDGNNKRHEMKRVFSVMK